VLERILKKVEAKFSNLLEQCKWINMGGGHLITDSDYDVEHLIRILKLFKKKYPKANVILEPGEAIGWQTGVLVSKVMDIIEKNDIKIAILNVSFSNHMPDTLEMPYKPRVINSVEPQSNKNLFSYKFGGLTCLAGDYLGDYYFENPLKIDDIIIFEDQMHYTFVKTNFFNGVSHPSIGKISKSGEFVLLKKFTYQDYKNRLS
jgi:carboxynorspermidine decarboxylase